MKMNILAPVLLASTLISTFALESDGAAKIKWNKEPKEKGLRKNERPNSSVPPKMLPKGSKEKALRLNNDNGQSVHYVGIPPNGEGNKESECLTFELEFQTDDWPEENKITLFDAIEGSWLWEESSFDPNSYHEFGDDWSCLDETGCYHLDIADTYGDGLVNGGYLRLSVNGEEVANMTSEVGKTSFFDLGNGCQAVTDPPTQEPECLQLDVAFQTDRFPEDNSFAMWIEDCGDCTPYPVDEYGFDQPDTLYEYSACLDPSECYTFNFWDDYGDGLVRGGYLKLSLDGEEIYYGSDSLTGYHNPIPVNCPTA